MQVYRGRCKASTAQLSYLAGYMASHRGMVVSGISQSLQERAKLDKSWEDLATKLNSMGGPIKTVAKWKQAWRDLRNNIKKKEYHKRKELCGHGVGCNDNEAPTIQKRTQVEEQVLSVIGPVAVHSMEQIFCTQPIEHAVNLPDQSSPLPTEPETLSVLPGPSSVKCKAQNPRLIQKEEERLKKKKVKKYIYSMQKQRVKASPAQLNPGSENGPSTLYPEDRESRSSVSPPLIPVKRKDVDASQSASDTDRLDKPRIIFRKLVKEKLSIAETRRELLNEELEERKLRKQILREELQHKRELHELEKKERLLQLDILRAQLRNIKE